MAGPSRLFGQLLAILAAGSLAAAPASAQFGAIGVASDVINGVKTAKKVGDALRKIDEPEEIKLGGDLAALLLGAAPLDDDAETQRYVNRVGRWLALHSERPNLPWKFGVMDTDDFNAFSTPGGYVLISRGLLRDMRNESELAGVLAHEIAHVVKRHQINALQKSMQNEALGAMDDYFGATSGIGGGAFTAALLGAGKKLYASGLDKEDEYEADRMAVVIAARAGYSPYGLGGVLQTLSGFSAKRSGFALMFGTHPTPISRIERLAKAMGTKLDTLPVQDDVPPFAPLRARLAPPAE